MLAWQTSPILRREYDPDGDDKLDDVDFEEDDELETELFDDDDDGDGDDSYDAWEDEWADEPKRHGGDRSWR